jgi:nucleoside-diphosphate-sugar epimerase
MSYRIFLAGASGAVGRRLALLLRDVGHSVVGATRSAEKTAGLRALGVEPVVVDVFDAEALARAMMAARPQIVIHQLTDLPPALNPALMGKALFANARLRDEGTRNLVQAAIAAGASRLVAQSIAWAYAPSPLPHKESDPLDIGADGDRAISLRGVIALEGQALRSPSLVGLVLRYGRLYGPGTGFDAPTGKAPLHVDAAAYAALLAIDRGAPGAYNIVEPNDEVTTDKARAELGWSADFRLGAAR